MKLNTRAYLAILLAALLALTGQSMAVARGASSPMGEIVLCTGTGPVMVLVDSEGNPTGPAHYCPDGAMSLMLAITPAVAMPVLLGFGRYLELVPVVAHLGGLELPHAQARGPPLS